MDAQSARLASLFLLLFVSPILLVISAFGSRGGWAEGHMKLESPARWGPPVGDIAVHLGYFNGTVTMSTPYGHDIDLDVAGAQGWGALVMALSLICLGGGVFILYHREQGANIELSLRAGTWVIRGGGISIAILTSVLYLCLAKTAHDEINEKLESMQIKDRSLWPHPGLLYLSALLSGLSMVASSFFVDNSTHGIETASYESLL